MYHHTPTTLRRRRGRQTAIALIAALSVALSACGDDDPGTTADEPTDEEPATESTAPTTGPTASVPATTPDTTAPDTTTTGDVTTGDVTTGDVTATTEAAGDSSTVPEADPPAACDPYYEVTAAMSGAADPSSLPSLFDELEPLAPAEIDASLQHMIDTARVVVEGGMQDFAPFETPEFNDAVAEVESWMFENCEFDNRAEVSAVDYRYDGVAESYPAGTTAFSVTNEGAEAHEMVLVRRNDDVTLEWDELLTLPEEESMSMAEVVGSAWVGEPGSSGVLVADLTPGDYIVVCFVPSGTTVADGGGFVEGTGDPHFMLGMRSEFSVS